MAQLLSVPLAGFTSPSYLTPVSAPSQGADAAKGMPIQGVGMLVLSVENSTGTRTVAWEQTLDPDGVTGWFPVQVTLADNYTTLSTNGSSNNKAYLMPAIGIRYRGIVTALATADFIVREQRYDTLEFPGYPPGAIPTGNNLIGGMYEAPSNSSTAGMTPAKTAAAAANLIIKNSACNLYGLNVDLPSGGVAAQLLLINSASIPADGAVTPEKTFKIPAASSLILDFDPPIRFSNGCVACLSSTGPFTKTALTGANLGFISGEAA